MLKPRKEPVPVPDYYCAQNIEHKEVQYKLYQDEIIGPKCFLFAKSGGGTTIKKQTWDDARKFCRDFGGDLVSIHSFEQNSYIMSHLNEESYWIGFGKEISSGIKPSKWIDGTDVDFDGWKDEALSQKDDDYCGIINEEVNGKRQGEWNKAKCSKTKRMVCEKDAILGHDPNPTEYPPVVPNENCESEWFYMESTGNCYHIDHYMMNSFDASEANCVGKGGHLASINSPGAQAEIRLHLNDPTSTGKI